MGWDDLHRTVTDELRQWTPSSIEQAALRDDYLAHLSAHGDGHRKAGPPAHLTASCLVFDEAGDRVLLTHHRKAREWFQFGGHLELGDDSLRGAAQREALEESGVDEVTLVGGIVELDRHDLVGDFVHCRTHLDVRFVATTAQQRPRVSAESLDVAWFAWDDLPNLGLTRLVTVARERLTER